MKTQLQKLCTFSAGLPNSKIDKATETDKATTFLIPGSAIGVLGEVLTTELQPVLEKDGINYSNHYIQAGDVLLLSRGTSVRAGLVDEELAKGALLANTTLTVIRPNKTKLLGETLVAFFNSEIGQNALMSMQKGAAILSLPLKDLKELEISVPDLATQQQIQELFHTSIEAYQDTIALAEQQRRAATTVMLKMMQGA